MHPKVEQSRCSGVEVDVVHLQQPSYMQDPSPFEVVPPVARLQVAFVTVFINRVLVLYYKAQRTLTRAMSLVHSIRISSSLLRSTISF